MEVQEAWYAKSFVSSWYVLVEYSASYNQNNGQQNRIDSCFLSSNVILLIWSLFEYAQN